jgi:hypothetical protein
MTTREESHNPALEAEPVEPVEKRYKVTGVTFVMEHKPGSEFTATLTPEQEESLTTYGHLEVVEGHKVGKPHGGTKKGHKVGAEPTEDETTEQEDE